jgi:hypothetical protein
LTRFAIYRAERTYLDGGGRAVLRDWVYSFRPIAASESERAGVLRPGPLTIRVGESAGPSLWIDAPEGAHVAALGPRWFLLPRPGVLLSPMEAIDAAIAGEKGLAAVFAPEGEEGVADGQ